MTTTAPHLDSGHNERRPSRASEGAKKTSPTSLELTERLHYFHAKSATRKYSFGRRGSSFNGQDTVVDDPCPASLEQRVSACTDVFEVWNNEARRRRANAAVNYSGNASHNPRRRSLSSALSSFSFASSTEGSTGGRERAGSESFSRSSSASGRSATLVIRVTPSNSSGSLQDLCRPDSNAKEDCITSSPSSGCVGHNDDSDPDHRPHQLCATFTTSSTVDLSDDFSEDFAYATPMPQDNTMPMQMDFSMSVVPYSEGNSPTPTFNSSQRPLTSDDENTGHAKLTGSKSLKSFMGEIRAALRRRMKRN